MISFISKLLKFFRKYDKVITVCTKHHSRSMARVGVSPTNKHVYIIKNSICRIHTLIPNNSSDRFIIQENQRILKYLVSRKLISIDSGFILFKRDVKFDSLTSAVRFLYGTKRSARGFFCNQSNLHPSDARRNCKVCKVSERHQCKAETSSC